MVNATRQIDEAQARKQAEVVRLLERLIDDVQQGRLFGEFGVRFTAQSGQVCQYEEHRKTTYK